MFRRQRMRFGGALMIIGSLIAAAGEIVNAQNMSVWSSSWNPSLALIVGGTFILLIGLSSFTSASERINGFGFIGSNLLYLGGLLLIIGTAALDWIILPFLLNLASTLASTINKPALATQDALNTIISSLNNLGGSTIQRLFPGLLPHIPPAHIPLANGTALVNKALVQLHLPTIDMLQWWGHIALSGGTLTIGCLLLGLSLLRRHNPLLSTSTLLITFALANLLCQLFLTIPAVAGNITAVALFLTLAWLGASAWTLQRQRIPRTEPLEVIEIDTTVPDNEIMDTQMAVTQVNKRATNSL